MKDWMYEGLHFFGEYEPWQTRVYESLVREGDTCLDVGANFGWYTTLFARWVGAKGRVLAFEPLPSIARLTEDALALNGLAEQVELCRFGLGDADGEFVVFQFDGLPHGHASASDLGRADARPTTCQVRTLEAVARERGLGRIDFVKVDVEGYEREVLAGGRTLLEREDAPIVAFEVNVACLSSRGVGAGAVQRELKQAGYERFWAIGPRREFVEVQGPLDEDVSRDYLAAKPWRAERVTEAQGRLRG